MEIQGQVAIVTGGASGMGAATAKALTKSGAKVAIYDIDIESAKKTAQEIDAIAIQCDVTNEASVKQAIDETCNKLGPVRICVNCAGVVHSRRMINKEGPMPLAQFHRIISINLVGTFNMMNLVASKIIPLEPVNESKERGVIINTASIAAFEGQIGQTAYSASKGGIISMTLPAARELAQFGIRVMAIAPGLVDTPMFEKIPPTAREALETMVPFPKRLAKPQEFAELVKTIIFNAMLNGSVIRLDGALRMQAR